MFLHIWECKHVLVDTENKSKNEYNKRGQWEHWKSRIYLHNLQYLNSFKEAHFFISACWPQ